MGSAGLSFPMASPFLLLILPLLPLTLSQFQPSYSYSPSYYTTQTSSAPFFTSPFTKFTPYTSYPSVSYLHTGFRNQNLKNVFSSYRSPSYQMQRTGKMFPDFSTQRRNMNRAPKSVKKFYPDQIRTPLIPALPKPEVTPAWQYQGKEDGRAVTKCHDGKVLPFRARCDKVIDCKTGEDEIDCEWHKR